MPHCAGFTYSALPTELSCLPSSPYLKGTSQFLTTEEREREREGGGNFFKVKWKCNSCLPGITRETSNSEETNKFAKIWAKRHLFSSKVDKREDDRGGGVKGGVGGGVSFTTIHIHHALASFLTMKEVQNKQHKNKQTNSVKRSLNRLINAISVMWTHASFRFKSRKQQAS